MLWLALQLPRLSLEIFERGNATGLPLGVADGERLVAVNTPALRGGVRAGMTPAAARALVPELELRCRDSAAEARALRQVAAWALQFTATLSLAPPAALLLEVGRSLRYFGGLEVLRGRLERGLAELGYRQINAVAPTPGAALLLARAGDQTPLTRPEALAERLGALPVQVLELTRERSEALTSLGIQRLAQCLALPRAGLARRLGPGLLRQLSQALGESPDVRPAWRAPAHFCSRLELPAPSRDTAPLLFACARLLRELAGYLEGRQLGVQRLRLRLIHEHQAFTPCLVGLVAPSRAFDHLLELVRSRLERLDLPAAVTALELAAADLQPLDPASVPLLEEAPGRDQSRLLVDRLAARLGERTVQGLQVRDEHRPEQAWAYAPADAAGDDDGPALERPLWLLPRPWPLPVAGHQPLWHGPLVLRSGPERIEGGWWDGQDVVRDYYVAANPAGERLWVFQDRSAERAWFLHGIFA